MRISSRVVICLALASLARAFREGAYRDLACQQAMLLLRDCQEGLLPAAETEAQCCTPFRALNKLQCLCTGRENLYHMLNLAVVANLRQCGEGMPAISVASSCALNQDVLSGMAKTADQASRDLSLDLDVDIDMEDVSEGPGLLGTGQPWDALDLQPAITLSLGGLGNRGSLRQARSAGKPQNSPVDVVVDVVLGLGGGEGGPGASRSSSVFVDDGAQGIDAQLDLMYDGENADVDAAMKRVSAWLMSLLPALSRQAGSSQADRMDRVEHMGGLLSTLGNVLSMVGDLLTSALQDSNPATDLDITYDINVEVDPNSRDYEANIDIDVNSNYGGWSPANMMDQLQDMLSFFWRVGSERVMESAGQATNAVTQVDMGTEVQQVAASTACDSLWCKMSQWVCDHQDEMMLAIQLELALFSLALLATFLWTLCCALLYPEPAPPAQEELLERLLGRCDSIEKAAEYVDAETNTISPLWAVMDKTKSVAS